MWLPKDNEDDFVKLEKQEILPYRPPSAAKQDSISFNVYPVPDENAVLISIQPPKRPKEDISHVPCDIVLVIDVSGSMSSPAPLPDTDSKSETSGLSILDLTKHAARTVLETLNEGDRLGIVTFSEKAHVIQPLTLMTEKAKATAWSKIKKLQVAGCTNLWSGIRRGLELFETAESTGNVQGLYVLTDGAPNHMCPPQGYVKKLQPMLKKMADSPGSVSVPSIHTFGFGYYLRSELLMSIAEVGNGNYAFIPDAGMIGTVFVHAVANLYSTYATEAKIRLRVSGRRSGFEPITYLPSEIEDTGDMVLKLGNLQFGQSRNILVRLANIGRGAGLAAELTCITPDGDNQTLSVSTDLQQTMEHYPSDLEYHLARTALLTFLASRFPLDGKEEHEASALDKVKAPVVLDELSAKIKSYHARARDQDASSNIMSLLADLDGSDPAGQIRQALTQTEKKTYWSKWGVHYLPSLLHAHMRQNCNTFKDPGPLKYGANSPLFIRCRDQLDAAFDGLPAPEPSLTRTVNGAVVGAGMGPRVSMSRYNRVDNPCFLGSCDVTIVPGDVENGDDEKAVPAIKHIKVHELRSGMYIWNPLSESSRQVNTIVKTVARADRPQLVCHIQDQARGQDLWITPWHPIFYFNQATNKQEWTFPIHIATSTRTLDDHEAVYSILLDRQTEHCPFEPDSHSIEIGNIPCVTLGHGLTSSTTMTSSYSNDLQKAHPRIHPYLGNYAAVKHDLSRLPVDPNTGHLLSAGIYKDETTGLACGFLPLGSSEGAIDVQRHSVTCSESDEKTKPITGWENNFNIPTLKVCGIDGVETTLKADGDRMAVKVM